MIIDIIAGARPNFMKVAALFAVSSEFPQLKLRLIHTGQHYDVNMSDVFFQDLELPEPTCHLGVGSGSHAVQTAEIMRQYEVWVQANRPDLCVVVGDVNSTVACALVASKLGIGVAHVEAGLRSFDRTMPEEINRIVTDSISSHFFVTESSGLYNLAREGHPEQAIHMVGHVMIDTLLRLKPKAEMRQSYRQFDVEPGSYAYVTMHRPSNVDDRERLAHICEELEWIAQFLPVVFPVHPRTHGQLDKLGQLEKFRSSPRIHLLEPVGYLDSVSLLTHSRLVITDSGGLQEESSALGIPCLTLRDNTERPVTLSEGTNTLIGSDWALLRERVKEIYEQKYVRQHTQIPYWDGQAGRRILRVLNQVAGDRS
jgi:UDP-N-acetylglucosamine 2-epimerase (non-hydrolysing)